MYNKFCKKQLWECSADLSSVAMGRIPAETVITNANLINVCTREIMENVDIAIHSGRIALVGDGKHCIGEGTKVIDAEGQYIAPGMLDGHIHVESSMLSVGEYARAVIPHGTTGIYYDPHEICNVMGLDGVNLMVADAERTPLKAMLTTPSCVPAVPGFEDSGAVVTSADIAGEMQRDVVVGLGEMMNFPGINGSNPETHAITGNTLKAGKIITGHYSIPDTGMGLNAYIASGTRCCHESTRAEDALAKMRLGMYAMFREGSAWHDLKVVAKSITENEVDSRFACLISDDTHPHTLLNQGHLDHIVRRAIEEGIDPITAVKMVTLNCAQCFKMDDQLGSITPGKCTDIVFIDNEKDINITRVLVDGDVVAEDADGQVFEVYVDGEEEEIVATNKSLEDDTFYTYSIDEDGIYTLKKKSVSYAEVTGTWKDTLSIKGQSDIDFELDDDCIILDLSDYGIADVADLADYMDEDAVSAKAVYDADDEVVTYLVIVEK